MNEHQDAPARRLSRRHALGGAAGLGLAAPLLAACGGEEKSAKPAGSAAGPTTTAVADVPVGGGVVDAKSNVVITQPTKGDVHVFTATCTHQGCQVSKVLDGVIECGCHGSQFSIADGSVKQGPAQQPLPTVKFTIKSGKIVLS